MRVVKKVLVIGNASSIWIKEYIHNIHFKCHNTVYVTAYDPLSKEYLREYEDMNVSVVNLFGRNKAIDKLTKAAKLILFCFKNRNNIDCIDIQSPPHSFQARLLSFLISAMGKKVVVTFWGSDLLRIDSKKAMKIEPIIKKADIINLPSDDLKEKFEYYFHGRYLCKETTACFGSPAFQYIKEIKDHGEKNQCKKWLGAEEDTITVAIGYNGSDAQQHLKIICSLKKQAEKFKDRITILIHLGYGFSEDYVEQIEEMLSDGCMKYILLKEMMPLEDVAKLRSATDIMIHGQTTDALSGSIREAVFAGAVLINPEWIKYREFERLGIEYIEYSSFDELSDVLEKIINKEIVINTEKNAELMFSEYSWDSVYEDWMRIFNERTD